MEGTTRDHKIDQINGLRGVGAFVVLTCHFQILFAPGYYDFLYRHFLRFLSPWMAKFALNMAEMEVLGTSFLHIFWAMSAYVIFKKLFQKNNGSDELPAHMIKRYVRLVIPCAVSVFFSYFLYISGVIHVNELGIKTKQDNLYAFEPSFLHAFKSAFWDTLFDYDYGRSYNGPLWTMSHEFWASILCFAMLAITFRSKARLMQYLVVFSVAFLLKLYWLNSFLIGFMLCDYHFAADKELHSSQIISRVRNSVIFRNDLAGFLTLIILYLMGHAVMTEYPSTIDGVSSFLGCSMMLASLKLSFIRKMLSTRLLTWLGDISFGLYVLHWPLICSFSSWAYLHYHVKGAAEIFALFIITIAICMVLAVLFFRFVDRASIRLSHKAFDTMKKLV